MKASHQAKNEVSHIFLKYCQEITNSQATRLHSSIPVTLGSAPLQKRELSYSHGPRSVE